MPLTDSFSSFEFAELVVLIVFAWILVDLWRRVIDNLTFEVMKLNKKSLLHTFVIALTTTVIFLTIAIASNIIEGGIESSIISGGIQPIIA